MSITDGSNPLTSALPLFLFQLFFIVVVARSLGILFRYIKQPQVVAEVMTGLVLGPSVLGHIPNFTKVVFPEHSLDIIYIVSNVGLIFFMFLIGLELDPSLMKNNFKQSVVIAIVSMAVPFGVGAAFDNRAWILLALVVSIARSSGDDLNTLWVVLIMAGFIVIVFFVVKPILERLNRRTGEKMREMMLVIVLLLILMFSWITEVIGIHAIFGGFLMGVIIPREGPFATYLAERIEDLVVVLLLPLYFTFSGLRTSLGALDTWTSWGACAVVIVLACAGKIFGTTVAAKAFSHSMRESLTLGILMNTKGLVELIVLNIGLDVGVLNQELFSIFVMMALVTTMITSPALYFIWVKHALPTTKNAGIAFGDYDTLA